MCGSILGIRHRWTRDNRNAHGARHQFAEQAKPLGIDVSVHGGDPGDVAARPIEAGDEALLNRVSAGLEDNGNRRSRRFGGKCRQRTARSNDGDLPPHQVGRQIRHPSEVIFRKAVFNCNVATLGEACFAQTLRNPATKVSVVSRCPRKRNQPPASPAAAPLPRPATPPPRRRGG